jgi:pimeloyl-ACP methyl ester carboxylesterase
MEMVVGIGANLAHCRGGRPAGAISARHLGEPRPQEPRRPLPYDEVEIAVDIPGGGGGQLPCTLTKPRAAGRFAAVVLVTGSGPQDRHETMMGHKPFLVLSDAITRAGVAVLPCDDRGVGKSTGAGALGDATTFDFAADALAEVVALRARSDVDPSRVGVVGHSEGAIVATLAAARAAGPEPPVPDP